MLVHKQPTLLRPWDKECKAQHFAYYVPKVMVKSQAKCLKVHIYVLFMSIVGLVLIHYRFGFT
jgi:hypothetical protein